jgi:phosphatidylglycerophosphate synthase
MILKPNYITSIRFFLIPFLLYSILYKYILFSFFTFTIMIVSDFFDGYIARKYNQVSNFGAFLDAFIDKIMIISLYGLFFYLKIVSLYFVLILSLKEFSIGILTGLSFIYYKIRKKKFLPHAQIWGKINMIAISIHLMFLITYYFNIFSLQILQSSIEYMEYAIISISILSFILYFNLYLKYIIMIFIYLLIPIITYSQNSNNKEEKDNVIIINESEKNNKNEKNEKSSEEDRSSIYNFNHELEKEINRLNKRNISNVREEVGLMLLNLIDLAQKTLDTMIKKSNDEKAMLKIKRHDFLKLNSILSWSVEIAKKLVEDCSQFTRDNLNNIVESIYTNRSILKSITKKL